MDNRVPSESNATASSESLTLDHSQSTPADQDSTRMFNSRLSRFSSERNFTPVNPAPNDLTSTVPSKPDDSTPATSASIRPQFTSFEPIGSDPATLNLSDHNIVDLFSLTLRDGSITPVSSLGKQKRSASIMRDGPFQGIEKDSSVFKRAKKDKDKDKDKGKGRLSESIKVNTPRPCDQDIYKTYISSYGSFEIPQIVWKASSENLTPLWTLLQPEVNLLSPSIAFELFSSPFSPEELAALDLKSNAAIFPILINQEGDLRERGQKNFKTSSSDKWQDMIKRFEKKSQVFQDIEIAAKKQAKAYKDAVASLKISKKIQVSHTDLDSTITESPLHTLLKTNTTMSVQEWNDLDGALSTHLTCIAERFRQELLPLVIFIRRTSDILQQRETSLASLIAYAREAIKAEEPISQFFPKFLSSLLPGTHLCQCASCHTPEPESSIPANLSNTDTTPIDPDPKYRNPQFQIPVESVKLLYQVTDNWLSPVTVLDLEDHFKEPLHLSYQSAFDPLLQYENKIRFETDEINAQFQRESQKLQELDKDKMTIPEEYTPTTLDLAVAEKAKEECTAIYLGVQKEWEQVANAPVPLTPAESRRNMEYNHTKIKATFEEDMLIDWYKTGLAKLSSGLPFSTPMPSGSVKFLEENGGVASDILEGIAELQSRLRELELFTSG